jgi:hypothetical protein
MMGKQYDHLDDRLCDFIRRQQVFFVGTAPSGSEGHLNVSPKGLDTFRIQYRKERTQLTDYARNKGPAGLEQYRAQKNRKSIDGLDGLERLDGHE